METEDHKRKNCFNCKFLDAKGSQFWCNGKELSNPKKEDAQLKKMENSAYLMRGKKCCVRREGLTPINEDEL